jgi:tRNA-Thr(GGU) m(6)t(6)A37 methyltransferase TsaA
MISLEPIGVVRSARTGMEDDYWGGIVSEIVIAESLGAEALVGIEDFSHAEVIFYFHQVEVGKVITGARHPRGDTSWPKVGILAQRAKARPNRLGLSVVKIVDRSRNVLRVTGLDAIDGTPVLDVKPVMQEFLPRETVFQPRWATELMENYWKEST